jgi:hypothetical protein
MKSSIVVIVLSALALLCHPALAGITTYSGQAAWQAANPYSTVQDFSSVASGSYDSYSTPTDGTIATTNTVSWNGNGNIGGGSGVEGVTAQSPGELLGAPINQGVSVPLLLDGSGEYLAAASGSMVQTGTNGGYTEYEASFDGPFVNGCSQLTPCDASDPSSYQYSGYSYTTIQMSSLSLTPPTGTTALAFDIGQAYNYSASDQRAITATITTADNETQSLTVTNTAGSWSFFGFDASDPITSVIITAAVNPGVFTDNPAHTNVYYYQYDLGYEYAVYNDSNSTTDETRLAIDNLTYGYTPLQCPSRDRGSFC